MTTTLKIDFVSDVSCPWCIIGLKSLQQGAAQLGGEVALDLHFQPFELNPQMGPTGQDIGEHLGEKYGLSPQQLTQNQEAIRQRGAALGFTFDMHGRSRIYNTFDAHRLLHWADTQGKQLALKEALFAAYFTEGKDPSDHATLIKVAAAVGLDATDAHAVLASGRYADEVREQERFYQQQGISSVPAIIINEQYLISGGQPPEVFANALRQIAAQEAI
ncbi:Predicted dithiol-disulfide isomerase, DsbA family [Andreprevotia lacus DSM 23236]|jgi:predicted DsbA family dithiol-disulfide isomerase|uniref:Predicted dithiol-disulfide isomerase, DsbA family n=1 Tax=Andreprevotia lacus DSM 23236 TaxID=1121001 RepID=A0A1W1XVU8_9NEIS|nr:DsbA family oxidoreductase [Andreprevotia lacus]SMC28046.1 Predicted dithiol-disulfide isomerase, DsbA family [Andreprevotia lacus DSM 23236]